MLNFSNPTDSLSFLNTELTIQLLVII